MLWKCYTQYASKFGKLSSGHRTGKCQFSFQSQIRTIQGQSSLQSQRRKMAKGVSITVYLCSFQMLARLCSKSFKLCFSSMWTQEHPDVQAGVLKRWRNHRSKFPTYVGSGRKKGSSIKTSTSASSTMLKSFTVWITINWKIIKKMGIPDHLTCLLRNLYEGQEATVRTGHGKRTGSKLGKEYVKAVYCHPAYLTYVQSTSCEMLGWMKHKLESRLPGEISITLDMQITPPLWQKSKRNWRASWWKWKRRVKSWLETQNSENKDHGIWSHHFMSDRWGNSGNSGWLYFLGVQNHCRWWLQPWN